MANYGILESNEDQRTLALRLRQEPFAGRTFAVTLGVCDDPFCGCSDVEFTCVPHDPGPVSVPLVFFLNILGRRVGEPPPRSAEERALARAVCAELQEADWNALDEHFQGVKEEEIENVDADTPAENIPPEILSADDSMVEYPSIFPYADDLQFAAGGRTWTVADLYCVNPACHCRAAVLVFQEVGGGVEDSPEPSLLYDYRRGTIEPDTMPAPERPSLDALMEALKAEYPDIGLTLEQRHLQLRLLHLLALEKLMEEPALPVRNPEKIGRNDPCPCGSGKKHKKCCGR